MSNENKKQYTEQEVKQTAENFFNMLWGNKIDANCIMYENSSLSQKAKEAMRIKRQIIELEGRLKRIENEIVSEKNIEEWLIKNRKYKLFEVKCQRIVVRAWNDEDEDGYKIQTMAEAHFGTAEKAIEWAINLQKERFYDASAWAEDENGYLGVRDFGSYGETIFVKRIEV